MSARSARAPRVRANGCLLPREEGAQRGQPGLEALFGQGPRFVVVPPGFGDVPVGQDEAPPVHEKAGPQVLDLADGAGALRVQQGVAVRVPGWRAVLVQPETQGAPVGILEHVGALDHAHPWPELADDALAGGALALQGREPIARGLQLRAEGPRFGAGGLRDLGVERLLLPAQLLDLRDEGGAVRLRLGPLLGHPSGEALPVALDLPHRLPQPFDLEAQAAGPEVAPARGRQREQQPHDEKGTHGGTDPGIGGSGEDAQGGEAPTGALPRGGLEHLLARLASCFEPDEGTVRTELEHVPLAQDGIPDGLAVEPRLRPRVRALEHDLALALEDERVPRRGSRRAHVGLGAGTEHRGQRHLVHFAASWPREMPELDPGGHAGVAQGAAEVSTPGASGRSASSGMSHMGRF